MTTSFFFSYFDFFKSAPCFLCPDVEEDGDEEDEDEDEGGEGKEGVEGVGMGDNVFFCFSLFLFFF